MVSRHRPGIILLIGFLVILCDIKETRSQSNVTEVTTENAETTTTRPPLTGDPQKDYIYDINLPHELKGYDMSNYPFYGRVPDVHFDFNCTGLHDGFYASPEHECQVYHNCIFETRYDFLCPNFTVFDQKNFICNYASLVDCKNSDKFFFRNDELYVTAPTSTTAPTIIYIETGQHRPRPRTRRPQFRKVRPPIPRPGPKRTPTTTLKPQKGTDNDYYYDYNQPNQPNQPNQQQQPEQEQQQQQTKPQKQRQQPDYYYSDGNDYQYYDYYNDYYDYYDQPSTTSTTTTTTARPQTPFTRRPCQRFRNRPFNQRPGNRQCGGRRPRPRINGPVPNNRPFIPRTSRLQDTEHVDEQQVSSVNPKQVRQNTGRRGHVRRKVQTPVALTPTDTEPDYSVNNDYQDTLELTTTSTITDTTETSKNPVRSPSGRGTRPQRRRLQSFTSRTTDLPVETSTVNQLSRLEVRKFPVSGANSQRFSDFQSTSANVEEPLSSSSSIKQNKPIREQTRGTNREQNNRGTNRFQNIINTNINPDRRTNELKPRFSIPSNRRATAEQSFPELNLEAPPIAPGIILDDAPVPPGIDPTVIEETFVRSQQGSTVSLRRPSIRRRTNNISSNVNIRRPVRSEQPSDYYVDF